MVSTLSFNNNSIISTIILAGRDYSEFLPARPFLQGRGRCWCACAFRLSALKVNDDETQRRVPGWWVGKTSGIYERYMGTVEIYTWWCRWEIWVVFKWMVHEIVLFQCYSTDMVNISWFKWEICVKFMVICRKYIGNIREMNWKKVIAIDSYGDHLYDPCVTYMLHIYIYLYFYICTNVYIYTHKYIYIYKYI